MYKKQKSLHRDHTDAKGYLVCLYDTEKGVTQRCRYLMTRNVNRFLEQFKSQIIARYRELVETKDKAKRRLNVRWPERCLHVNADANAAQCLLDI